MDKKKDIYYDGRIYVGVVTKLPLYHEFEPEQGEYNYNQDAEYGTALSCFEQHLKTLVSYPVHGNHSFTDGMDVTGRYELKCKCPSCGGDGKETCDNPDHSFIEGMPGEVNRLGCPVCGHDKDYKVNGGKNPCPECDGNGYMLPDIFMKCAIEIGFEDEPETFAVALPLSSASEQPDGIDLRILDEQSLQSASEQGNDGDTMSIDALLSEFKRQGFDTSNWDGEEGAEKAIVDGVRNATMQWYNETLQKIINHPYDDKYPATFALEIKDMAIKALQINPPPPQQVQGKPFKHFLDYQFGDELGQAVKLTVKQEILVGYAVEQFARQFNTPKFEQVQGKEVQTAEEVLDEFTKGLKGLVDREIVIPFDTALLAMEQYASQFKTPPTQEGQEKNRSQEGEQC